MSYDIEDCIDDFMKSLGQTDRAKAAGLVQSVVQYQIQGLKARVEDASKRRMRYKLGERTFEPSISRAINPRFPSLYAKPDGLVGIGKPRSEIIKCLMEGMGASMQQQKVISIVGPAGLGKTTLANEVFRKLEGQFQCRAFVSLSQQPDVSKILRNILSQVCQQELPSTDIQDEGKLIDTIREVLKNKMYLVVIDDIWSTQARKILKCSLFLNDLGSRIMTTTRSIDIAKSCCSQRHDHVYEIMPLTAANSKSLFFKRIFGSEDICPPQLEEVSSEILKKCGGSPLAILTIAMVYNSIGSTLGKDPGVEEMRRILSLSYDDLPHHLKTCLLYLSIFPEDYEIERDRLIRRWIAEGFIDTNVKIQYDDQAVSCRVHDMILDLLTSKSMEENFATLFGNQNEILVLQHKIRRLSLSYYDQEHIMLPSTAIISHWRSLIIVGYAEKMPSLSKFCQLKTLDMGWTKITKMPKSIVQLQHLTCLHVSNMELPEGIGNLQALQEQSDIKVNRYSMASTHSNKDTFVDNLVSSLRKLGRFSLRSICICSHHGYSMEFLLDSWFPSPHLMQKFQMGGYYNFPRVAPWIVSLDKLTYLDINIDPVDEEALEILGELHALLFLWMTSKSAAPIQRLIISTIMFVCLREFHFTCWSNGEGLMFEAGPCRGLRSFGVPTPWIPFDAGSGLDFGIQHLSSLKHLAVEIICIGATARGVEALEEAIRDAVHLLPNRPAVEFRTWDDEKMVSLLYL
ncbi:hypothetical protein VPH35_054953 [Triticum aestivum]